jgi:hypothetical protein
VLNKKSNAAVPITKHAKIKHAKKLNHEKGRLSASHYKADNLNCPQTPLTFPFISQMRKQS